MGGRHFEMANLLSPKKFRCTERFQDSTESTGIFQVSILVRTVLVQYSSLY